MNFKLELLNKEDLPIFKKDMQEAFQIGFEENYGKTDGTILPEKDIDESLNTKGSIAYKAVVDNKIVHGYDTINLEIVWNTAIESIPELKSYCEEILN